MTYEPLTLSTHRDGNRYGQVVSNLSGSPVEIRVQVIRRDRHYSISVVGGDIKVYVSAGYVKGSGSSWTVVSADADGNTQGNRGYREYGKLAAAVERVVFEFLTAVHYAQREAAKSPEQKAAEIAEREANLNRARNLRIAREADALLATLEQLIPTSTAHYAVEDARKALTHLSRVATKGSIKTAVKGA